MALWVLRLLAWQTHSDCSEQSPCFAPVVGAALSLRYSSFERCRAQQGFEFLDRFRRGCELRPYGVDLLVAILHSFIELRTAFGQLLNQRANHIKFSQNRFDFFLDPVRDILIEQLSHLAHILKLFGQTQLEAGQIIHLLIDHQPVAHTGDLVMDQQKRKQDSEGDRRRLRDGQIESEIEDCAHRRGYGDHTNGNKNGSEPLHVPTPLRRVVT